LQQSLETSGIDDLEGNLSSSFKSWTTDGKSLICLKDGITRYSLPVERNQSIFKLEKAEDVDDLPEGSYIMHLNSKLYVRNPDDTDKPFTIYNSESLKIDQEATDALKYPVDEEEEKDDKAEKPEKPLTMKPESAHDAKTGRKMGNGPIFTDGESVFIVSQKKHVKPSDAAEEDDAPTVPTAIVIEQFSLTDNLKHTKSTTLLKNDQQDVFNQKNESSLDDFIKNSTFHTNGEYLLLCNARKRHLFDMSTGVRIEKQKDDRFSSLVIHDLSKNQFYGFAD